MGFSAEVLPAGGGGHAVLVPRDVAGEFDSKRSPVLAHVNGAEYRSRLMVYGGKSYLGLRQDLLKAIGVVAGDTVQIDLQLDLERVDQPSPPPTEPVELSQALAADQAARAAYDALAPSHRTEYARWIAEGKQPGTRAERTAKMLRRLRG